MKLSRRRLLSLGAALPASLLGLACSSGGDAPLSAAIASTAEAPAPTATPAPPFIPPEAEERRTLMPGTPYETPLYVFATGRLGPIILALGGVHGNEPGGWLAAEQIVDRVRPDQGALLVIPRANRQATLEFVRTTDTMGDLNRLYPGDVNGLPMAQMAATIVALLREFQVSNVVDMHESWEFFNGRVQNGTAFLGQTLSTGPNDSAQDLARRVVSAVNGRILAAHEELFLREFPSRNTTPNPAQPTPQGNPGGGSRSSLGLGAFVPGVTPMLVEMGQQQSLQRRVALHVEVLREVMRQTGAIA